jgi:hypothetical protein
MWEPQCLTILWASMASNRNNVTLYLIDTYLYKYIDFSFSQGLIGCVCALWKWRVFLKFQRNVLPLMLKMDTTISSEMLATQPACMWFIYPGYVELFASNLQLSWQERLIYHIDESTAYFAWGRVRFQSLLGIIFLCTMHWAFDNKQILLEIVI